MRNTLFIACVIFLAGCATTQKYEAMLDTYIGVPEDALLRHWGVPQNVYESGGKKYLVYVSDEDVYDPGVAPTYQTTIRGNRAYTHSYGGIPPSIINLYCETTFIIEHDRVTHWSHKGNDCVSD